jgi:hypothetical protein
MIDNRKARQAILEILYHAITKDIPLKQWELSSHLGANGIDTSCLNFNLRYLQRKGYVNLPQLSNSFSNITITDKGIEHIEAGKNFSMMPSEDNADKVQSKNSTTTNVTIQGPNYGPVSAIAGQGNTVNNYMQISNAFHEAEKVLTLDSFKSLSEKALIRLLLKELKTELCNGEKANKGKLEEGLEWLKQHALEIAAIVEPLILKTLGM